jgi:hypothetical protein
VNDKIQALSMENYRVHIDNHNCGKNVRTEVGGAVRVLAGSACVCMSALDLAILPLRADARQARSLSRPARV